MKKIIIVMLGLLLAVSLAVAAIPAARDEVRWQWASFNDQADDYAIYLQRWPGGRHADEARSRFDEHGWADAQTVNTVKDFEQYLLIHPEGRYVAEAKDKIESLYWQEAGQANNVQGFERYVQRYPAGRHVAEAKNKIESLHWKEAASTNTIKSYRSYTAAHPEGKFVQQAEKKIAELLSDDKPFEAALKAGTESAIERFLVEFPGHRKESQAKQALKDIAEGLDIVDALQAKKIEVKSEGSGITNVSVRIRRRVPYPMTIRIPVGTFLVSGNSSAQNMVTTAASKVYLVSDDWQSDSPNAACANRPKDIPENGDTFTVQRSPQQAELKKLMPVLEKAGADTETRQAAVWIVTDNADYSDLGILVASQFGFGGSRVINEQEAAQAMKICEDAGIDIAKKAIWQDRQKIITGLKDANLKGWLEKRK